LLARAFGNMKKVIVYTFPPVPKVYNISPFAIKVESYLRLNKIPYEVVYTSKFGPKGKIPYIHLCHDDNTIEVIPDSNVIISRLEEEFGKSQDDLAALTPEESAMGHAVIRMLDEHTSQIAFYYRYCLHMEEFAQVLDLPNSLFHADISSKGKFISKMFVKSMPKGFGDKIKKRGLARHSDEELWKFSNDDLQALSNYLGNKTFFFGRDHPTSVDCTIFGHLSQILYIPLDFPQKDFLNKNCQNIVSFMERFRMEYWADWDDKCERKPNQQLISGKDAKPFSRRNYLLISAFVVFTSIVLFQIM
jgi:glutathione S-transferase